MNDWIPVWYPLHAVHRYTGIWNYNQMGETFLPFPSVSQAVSKKWWCQMMPTVKIQFAVIGVMIIPKPSCCKTGYIVNGLAVFVAAHHFWKQAMSDCIHWSGRAFAACARDGFMFQNIKMLHVSSAHHPQGSGFFFFLLKMISETEWSGCMGW